jgi:DNA-binding XRE family transcriptional regulator
MFCAAQFLIEGGESLQQKDEPTRQRNGEKLPYLAAWRRWQMWSQEMLSEKSGVARATINRLEGGNIVARWTTINKLAEAIGISARELVGENPEKGAGSDAITTSHGARELPKKRTLTSVVSHTADE